VIARAATTVSNSTGHTPTLGWGPTPAALGDDATGASVTGLSRIRANFVPIDERRVGELHTPPRLRAA